MTDIPKIGKRLEAAAGFSRKGVCFADIGTDHAYLPIFLYTTARAPSGIAADINKGPVERAKSNIKAWGAQNAIKAVCTDGLSGLQLDAPADIFILGMGGELIVKIIDEAKWLCAPEYRLVLQPMTHPEILRKYLFDNGFSIIDECLVKEEKIYQIMCAEYTGNIYKANELELLLGRINTERRSQELFELASRMRTVFYERFAGKQSASADTSYEEMMIKMIDDLKTEETR